MIGKPRCAFKTLKPVWGSTARSTRSMSVLLSDSETPETTTSPDASSKLDKQRSETWTRGKRRNERQKASWIVLMACMCTRVGIGRIGADNFYIILFSSAVLLCSNENWTTSRTTNRQKLTGHQRPPLFVSRGAEMKPFNLIAVTLSGAKQAYLKAGQV